MDFTLDIIITRDKVKKLSLNEKLVEWGGEKFPLDPPEYISDSNLVFKQFNDLSYYNKLLEEELDKDKYVAFVLRGETLLDLEFLINREGEKISNNKLFEFLEKVIKLDEFFIFLIREDEVVKKTYEISEKEKLANILCNSLNWSTPEDILIKNGE